MNRIASLVRHDTRLMWRYGIYPAYLFVILVTAVLMLNLGHLMPDWLIAITVFSDYAALGYFFLGGMMMLERSENTRLSLSLTPLSGREYLASKMICLLGLVLVMAIILAFASGRMVHWPLYLTSVLLVSIFYIGLGAFLALKFKTVTGYIVGAALLFMPLFGPCWLALLDPLPAGLVLIPTVSQLKLIIVSFEGAEVSARMTLTMLIIAFATAIAGLWLGGRALEREFGRK